MNRYWNVRIKSVFKQNGMDVMTTQNNLILLLGTNIVFKWKLSCQGRAVYKVGQVHKVR